MLQIYTTCFGSVTAPYARSSQTSWAIMLTFRSLSLLAQVISLCVPSVLSLSRRWERWLMVALMLRLRLVGIMFGLACYAL